MKCLLAAGFGIAAALFPAQTPAQTPWSVASPDGRTVIVASRRADGLT